MLSLTVKGQLGLLKSMSLSHQLWKTIQKKIEVKCAFLLVFILITLSLMVEVFVFVFFGHYVYSAEERFCNVKPGFWSTTSCSNESSSGNRMKVSVNTYKFN